MLKKFKLSVCRMYNEDRKNIIFSKEIRTSVIIVSVFIVLIILF